jgi:hypothetical protein
MRRRVASSPAPLRGVLDRSFRAARPRTAPPNRSEKSARHRDARTTEIYELDEDQRTFETPPRTRTGRRCLATNTNARPLPGRASDRPSWLWNDTPKGLPCPYFERLPLPYRLLLRMKIQRPHSARAETATSE